MLRTRKTRLAFIALVLFSLPGHGQADDFKAVRAEVDFSEKLRNWDGFGFNYVETAQTYDYKKTRRTMVDLNF